MNLRLCSRSSARLAASSFAVLALAVCLHVHAQVAGGALQGTILDPSGAVVTRVHLDIKNTSTGVIRTAETNTDGFYTVANLTPGPYEITASAAGFNTEVRRGILMTVGAQQTLNLTLRVGTETRKVEVTSEVPAIQLISSDISAVVNATTVRELPLNGRSWTDLATLQPGVDTIYTQPSFAVGADRGNRGFGQQLTISGARPQQNNYRLDGVSLNDYANGAPGSVLGGNLGVDAIQEFSVLTSNYSAQYGKTSGGVVNAVTRTGTNAFHGSAYEFLRNSALDARNYFDGDKIPPFKRNQFGGAVGGPIFKDRTFFFADYEGVRQAKGLTAVDTVPTLAARAGHIHDSSGNPITVSVDPAAQKYLPLYPLPNGAVTDNPDIATFSFAGQQVVNENFVTTRIDHRFSEKDGLFGTYMFDRTPYNSPDGMNNVLLGSLTSRHILAVEETHSFTSALVNALRFGYQHQIVNNNQSVSAINPAAADPSLGSFAGRNAAQVQISAVTPMPGGVGGLPTYLYGWDSFQIYDDAFLTKGTHSLAFGFSAERMHLNVSAFTDPNGIWQFKTLQDFLTNNPKRFQGGVVSTVSPRHLRQTLFGAYVQDDWRWKPNLTLNLGLRYEMSTVPTETSGKLSNLRNLTDAVPHLGDPFFSNPTTRDFEPRVGFAWDPFRTGKTAVRGGVGLFDVQPLPYQFILLTTLATPFFKYTVIPKSDFTTPQAFFSGLPSVLPAGKIRGTYIEPNPKRNYVMQWNLNVQQQLTPTLSAMVAYVGSRGVHQPFRVDDADQVMPTKTAAGYLWPQVDADGNLLTTGQPPSRFNENFGSIRGMFYVGRSYYNALELQVAKRMSHGFQVQGAYTWGKSIDTSSATVAGDAFGNSISSLTWFDPRVSRGVSDYNIGRTFVLNGTWEVPAPKSLSGPVRWFSDGWQLGMIFQASDGVPFSPTFATGGDPLGTLSSDDWDVPNRLTTPGCSSLINPGNPDHYVKTECFTVPAAPTLAFWNANCDKNPPSVGGPVSFPDCFNLRGNAGRNILTGPGVTEMDFSIFKNNHIRRISETFNVQFRAELFNALNHANFAPPTTPDNTDIFDGTGAPTGVAGRLSRTSTTAREIQFAVKFIW